MRPWTRENATGGVYLVSGQISPKYVGSCASLGSPTHFVTAAHCVMNYEAGDLRVNHWGHKELPFSSVHRISVDTAHDVAVLEVEVEDPVWIQPFTGVSGGVYWGEPITTIGSPTGLLTDHTKEALRVIRGFVQRSFIYTGRLGHTYSALELSFPAPLGLSGAPVFAEAQPRVLLGVVTENYASYTLIDSVEEELTKGEFRRIESRSIVTYGIAVLLFNALPFLEESIQIGNLNAAEQR